MEYMDEIYEQDIDLFIGGVAVLFLRRKSWQHWRVDKPRGICKMTSEKMRVALSKVVTYISAASVTAAAIVAILQHGFYFAEDLYPFLTGWFGLWTVLILLKLITSNSKGQFTILWRADGSTRNLAMLITLISPFLIVVLYAVRWLQGPLSAQGTMNEMLRWSFYGSFAVLAYISVGSKGAARIIIAAWHIVGMSLSVSALLAVCGNLQIPHFVAYSTTPGVSVTGARLGGLLQYPNTFGAVMAVFLLERLFAVCNDDARQPLKIDNLALKQSVVESRGTMRNAGAELKGTPLLRMLPLFPYLAALLLSESRGAWLAAACACAAVLPWKRLSIAPLLAAGAAPVAAAALLYRQLAAARLAVEPLPGLLALAGLWAGALLAGLWLCRRQRSAAGNRAAVLVLAALGWTAGAAAVLQLVHARITGPSSTVSARALLFRDAWKLAEAAPWLGQGGETWRSVYFAAQSRPYVGSQIHNGYLDILLNLGIFGLLITLLMLAAIGWLLAVTSARLLPPFLVIVLHSAVDFDWSYGLIWQLLFWLPALAVATTRGRVDSPFTLTSTTSLSSDHMPIRTFSRYYIAATVCCFFLVLSTMSWRANTGTVLYRNAVVLSNPVEKKRLLQQAIHWNPLLPQAAIALSELLPREQGKSVLKVSLKHSPESSALNWRMAEIFLREDKPEVALLWVRRSLSLDVYNYAKRTEAIQAMLLLGRHRLSAGDMEGAQLSAAAGLQLLREYKLLAEATSGVDHNDRNFHFTEQAGITGERLKSLLLQHPSGLTTP